jgi:hypothetical protein
MDGVVMSEGVGGSVGADLAALIADIASSDGTAAVEIAGVRIERCYEYGKTATTIDLEQTRLDLAAVEATANAAGREIARLTARLVAHDGRLAEVSRLGQQLREARDSIAAVRRACDEARGEPVPLIATYRVINALDGERTAACDRCEDIGCFSCQPDRFI